MRRSKLRIVFLFLWLNWHFSQSSWHFACLFWFSSWMLRTILATLTLAQVWTLRSRLKTFTIFLQTLRLGAVATSRVWGINLSFLSLNFRFKSNRVSSNDWPSSLNSHLVILVQITAFTALALCCTGSTVGETLAVEFQTLSLSTVTGFKVLSGRWFWFLNLSGCSLNVIKRSVDLKILMSLLLFFLLSEGKEISLTSDQNWILNVNFWKQGSRVNFSLS